MTQSSVTSRTVTKRADSCLVRQLGIVDYTTAWQWMKAFTDQRDHDTTDEIWLLQHSPVFTLGQAGKIEHLLNPGDIPVVNTDRGGQVTYHGPGQLIAYLLLDIKRLHLGVRQLVDCMEQSLIRLLAHYDIQALARAGAPGVYVGDGKIAALGLRVRRGCSFHGLSLNLDVDLDPFERINPCGYAGLKVIRMCDYLTEPLVVDCVARQLVEELAKDLGYTELSYTSQAYTG